MQWFPVYSRWSSTRLRAIGRFLASNWIALCAARFCTWPALVCSATLHERFSASFCSGRPRFPRSHRLSAAAERFAHRLLKSGTAVLLRQPLAQLCRQTILLTWRWHMPNFSPISFWRTPDAARHLISPTCVSLNFARGDLPLRLLVPRPFALMSLSLIHI